MHRLLKRIAASPETTEVAHTVLTSVVAIGVLTFALAREGWGSVSFFIAAAIGLITLRILAQVVWSLRHFRERTEMAHRMAREAEVHYVSVLKRIVRFTEMRDGYDKGRSERIARLCEQMAQRLGFSADKSQRMNIAGWLHDIGLLAVPENILHKASRLSGDEFRSIKRHAEASYEVLCPLEMLQDVLPAIRHHHERLNGTGYPDGLCGEEIPLEARILAVADAYDALTHDRPHRTALSPLMAIEELRRCSPAGYDRSCVEAAAGIANVPLLEVARASKMRVDSGERVRA